MGWKGMDKARAGIKEASDKALRRVVLTSFTTLLFRSPVDTGRFRGNWRSAVGWVDRRTEELWQSVSRGGPPTGVELTHLAPGMEAKWGQIVYISNDLPYGEALEGGHSPQAPAGVLHTSANEVRAKIQAGRV